MHAFSRTLNVSSHRNAVQQEDMLYTDEDLERSFGNITAIDYHQELEANGIKFTAYNAGHVLGAAMFVVDIGGVKLLYTGDYSREEDRHLMAAENPGIPMDVLVVESTYGVQSHQPRHIRESRFTGLVHDIVQRGGRCLIPVFALGRAQELLLILDEYWQAHPELHAVPVFYASSLAKKCMAIYQTYVNMMNDGIKRQIASGKNPFHFKHVQNLRHPRDFKDDGPCVMMASPAMLQAGFSRELFEAWCGNRKNGVIIPGYVVDGTLGKHIMSEPKEVQSQTGAMLPLRMSVEYISFSAHVDFAQNAQFIDEVRAPNVVLVHGEANEMGRLKAALQHRYTPEVMRIYTPRNCESVELLFHGRKYVKIVGKLAEVKPHAGQLLDGILVAKDFEYQLMAVDDLPEFTNLRQFTLIERLTIPSRATPSLVEYLLVNMFGRKNAADNNGILSIMNGKFKLEHKANTYVLEWSGNSLTDMLADSIIAVILSAETSRAAVKATQSAHGHKHAEGRSPLAYLDIVKKYLEEQLGPVTESMDDGSYRMVLDGHLVRISMEDLSVSLVEHDGDAMSTASSSSTDDEQAADETVKRVSACIDEISRLISPDVVI